MRTLDKVLCDVCNKEVYDGDFFNCLIIKSPHVDMELEDITSEVCFACLPNSKKMSEYREKRIKEILKKYNHLKGEERC